MANLSENEMQELTDAFRMFDRNGDGSITADELASVLRSMGQNPTQTDIKNMIDEMDPNGNGKIEFREFVDGVSKQGIKSQQQEEDELRAAFKVFDRDGNGFITASELRHTMTTLGERMSDHEVDAMINEADMNGDGKVNYDEFCKIMSARS